MKNLAKILAVLASMIPVAAHAGPGAVIYGCIYLPVAPVSPLSVTFTAGSSTDHCMNSSGATPAQPLQVTAAGVSCTSIGYVEAQASTTLGNTCGSDDSLWTLSYSVAGTGDSGSAQTDWPKNIVGIGHNNLSLQNQSPGTTICSTNQLCGSATTSITWDSGTQGPLYIIFNPQS